MNVGNAAQPGDKFRLDVELEQAEHLGVAILFDHVNPVVILDEFVDFAGERISFEAQIIGFKLVFVAHLVAGFDDSPVRSAIGDDADFRSCRS